MVEGVNQPHPTKLQRFFVLLVCLDFREDHREGSRQGRTLQAARKGYLLLWHSRNQKLFFCAFTRISYPVVILLELMIMNRAYLYMVEPQSKRTW